MMRVGVLFFLLSAVGAAGTVATKTVIFDQVVDLANETKFFCDTTFENQLKKAITSAASKVCTNNTFTYDKVTYLKVGSCTASTVTRRLGVVNKQTITSKILMPATDADQLAFKCNDAMKAAFLAQFKSTLELETGKTLGVDSVSCPRIAGRAMAIGLGIGIPAIAGLGVGLGVGLTRNKASSTPVPVSVAPVTLAPVTVAPTEAPGSSIPLWAGILLGLALLACIGAAIFASQKKEKKKKPVKKKAAPVQEVVRVVEEVQPMLAPPMVYQSVAAPTYQPTYQAYAAPQPMYQPAPVAYTSMTRPF